MQRSCKPSGSTAPAMQHASGGMLPEDGGPSAGQPESSLYFLPDDLIGDDLDTSSGLGGDDDEHNEVADNPTNNRGSINDNQNGVGLDNNIRTVNISNYNHHSINIGNDIGNINSNHINNDGEERDKAASAFSATTRRGSLRLPPPPSQDLNDDYSGMGPRHPAMSESSILGPPPGQGMLPHQSLHQQQQGQPRMMTVSPPPNLPSDAAAAASAQSNRHHRPIPSLPPLNVSYVENNLSSSSVTPASNPRPGLFDLSDVFEPVHSPSRIIHSTGHGSNVFDHQHSHQHQQQEHQQHQHEQPLLDVGFGNYLSSEIRERQSSNVLELLSDPISAPPHHHQHSHPQHQHPFQVSVPSHSNASSPALGHTNNIFDPPTQSTLRPAAQDFPPGYARAESPQFVNSPDVSMHQNVSSVHASGSAAWPGTPFAYVTPPEQNTTVPFVNQGNGRSSFNRRSPANYLRSARNLVSGAFPSNIFSPRSTSQNLGALQISVDTTCVPPEHMDRRQHQEQQYGSEQHHFDVQQRQPYSFQPIHQQQQHPPLNQICSPCDNGENNPDSGQGRSHFPLYPWRAASSKAASITPPLPSTTPEPTSVPQWPAASSPTASQNSVETNKSIEKRAWQIKSPSPTPMNAPVSTMQRRRQHPLRSSKVDSPATSHRSNEAGKPIWPANKYASTSANTSGRSTPEPGVHSRNSNRKHSHNQQQHLQSLGTSHRGSMYSSTYKVESPRNASQPPSPRQTNPNAETETHSTNAKKQTRTVRRERHGSEPRSLRDKLWTTNEPSPRGRHHAASTFSSPSEMHKHEDSTNENVWAVLDSNDEEVSGETAEDSASSEPFAGTSSSASQNEGKSNLDTEDTEAHRRNTISSDNSAMNRSSPTSAKSTKDDNDSLKNLHTGHKTNSFSSTDTSQENDKVVSDHYNKPTSTTQDVDDARSTSKNQAKLPTVQVATEPAPKDQQLSSSSNVNKNKTKGAAKSRTRKRSSNHTTSAAQQSQQPSKSQNSGTHSDLNDVMDKKGGSYLKAESRIETSDITTETNPSYAPFEVQQWFYDITSQLHALTLDARNYFVVTLTRLFQVCYSVAIASMACVWGVHQRALEGVLKNGEGAHVLLCYAFLQAFSPFVTSVLANTPPWAHICLWYAFLAQYLCMGDTNKAATFQFALPVLFVLEGVSRPSYLLVLNPAELMMLAFCILLLREDRLEVSLRLFLIVSGHIMLALMAGDLFFVQWFLFISQLDFLASIASDVKETV